ncbi:family 43 glycosylhydrolase [Pedobacter sp. AW31-3R]|uniref:family 43 glycosylhydrolase n=1 Tax=Pedobacter sp. AW31-3R TaxID=3445781 RepID=UPI003F9FA948
MQLNTRFLSFLICLLFSTPVFAQPKAYNALGAGNPVLPGYFADPTVKKFGDTYYIYATTDGNGGGFGPSQVWRSKDFVNWSLQDMNWPTTHHYWAPDVTQAKDGKYYMYYCQPVEIFGAWASSPVGPWTPLLPDREPVVRNFLVPNVITLDGQTFRDDDGQMYMFWGTWGIYPNHGCGVGLLNPDMKSFAKLAQIPNTVAKDFFEAPFMFKRNGIYYLTYSSGRCEDDTYRVQYATSKTGPMGPFVYGKNNPILVTNADGTVHGPGHQSVLQEGNDFYLIYHRHNNPHSGGGYHRQVAADKLVFDAEGNIEKLVPTHTGVGYLAKNANPSLNLALGKKVTASSSYSEDFKPEYAVDDNNGTLWKPKNNTSESWLTVDLGAVKNVKSVLTQFEFATWYYQYLIESSTDGQQWTTYADQTKNTVHGSPMINTGNVKARFIRLTITNTEYPGLNKAVWNMKVYADDKYNPAMGVAAKDPATIPNIKPQGLLVDLDAGKFEQGEAVSAWQNTGKMGGSFVTSSAAVPSAEIIGGKKAVVFAGNSFYTASFKAPLSLSGNSSFSVSMWVNNPVIADEEPILSWTARGGVDMTNATVGYGSNKRWGAAAHWGWADMPYTKLPEAGKWHHIALVFDGTNERLYIDGILDRIELKMLYLANLRNFVLGTTADENAFFSGALASLKVYDTALTEAEVIKMAADEPNSDVAIYLDAAKLPYGDLKDWKNEGYMEGNFIAGSGDPVVKDISGKIAVSFKNEQTLAFSKEAPDFIKEGKPNTVVMQVMGKAYGAGWHHVVNVTDGQQQQTYVDGQLKKVTDATATSMTLGAEKAEGALEAVASFMLYNHGLTAEEVAGLYSQWKKNSMTAVVKASFLEQPKALSTDMVSMSANKAVLPGSAFQYEFTETTGKAGAKSSGWQNNGDYINYGLKANQQYGYSVKIRDNYGNVTSAAPVVKVKTSSNLFTEFNDTFSVPKNYLDGTTKPFWDGFTGKADTLQSADGTLTLVSTNTKWDGGTPAGPFLYKEVTGDFIVQVKVTDVSGLKEKKANGANDAGLMVRASDGSFKLLQNSIFPGWGVGNMVTNLDRNGRAQTNNSSAWDFYRYLQIQRSGDTFYLRGSSDGLNWKDLPGSPLKRADIGNAVQVGLFHATYGEQRGYGQFDDFKIIQPKAKQ